MTAELWVLLDGVGFRFAERHRLLDWLPARVPLRTVLGYSATAVPTLLTGLSPSEHGAWTLYFRSPATSPFRWTRPFARLPLERLPRLGWRVREWVKRETVRRHGITGYFELYDVPSRFRDQFDVNWRRNLFYDQGAGPTFFSRWMARGPAFVGAQPHSDEAIVAAAHAAIEGGTSHVFCYLAELDALLHASASHQPSARVETALQAYGDRIRSLAGAMARRHGDVRILVFSDHGMTPVDRTVALSDATEGLVLGRDYMTFLDATLARYWSERPAVLDSIARVLARHDGGRLLDAEHLRAFDVPVAPDKYGQLVWLADPGVVISPNWMGRDVPSGMHGYTPDDSWSDGILFTNDIAEAAQATDIIALGRRLCHLAAGD